MNIKAIRMPKWGLAMEEGIIVEWIAQEGDEISEGDELMDIETTKITNVLEATNSGRLARVVAGAGEIKPVGALIGVLTVGEVSNEDIEAFIAASPATVVEDSEEGLEADALNTETITVGNLALNVATVGSGTPVVLLHGFSGDFNNWLFVIEGLKGAAKIIAPDLPGHGSSSKDVGDGSIKSFADAVVGVLKSLDITETIVVGHSFGGAVAMQLALDHPGLVSQLGLICPAGLPGGTLDETFLTAIVEAEKVREVKKALQPLVKNSDAISRDMVNGVTRAIRIDGARDALGRIKEQMLKGPELGGLKARLADLPPTTVIASRHDRIVGVPDATALPDDWSIFWIEDAGHLPHLEAATEVNSILRSLI